VQQSIAENILSDLAFVENAHKNTGLAFAVLVCPSDVNKAISIKAKALIPKAKDYHFVSRPGQGRAFPRPSVCKSKTNHRSVT